MGKRAKIDYEQQANTIRAGITATASPAVNTAIQNIVTAFSSEQADTETLFRNMVDAADEATLAKIKEGLENTRRDLTGRVQTMAGLIPEYNLLTAELARFQQAKEQMEEAMRYPHRLEKRLGHSGYNFVIVRV